MKDKLKILIVEDRPEQMTALAGALSKDYNIVKASNLKEAQSKLSSEIRLVLADIRLNETDTKNKDGLLLLAEIKKKRRKLPVVMMTAYGDVGLANESRKLGAFDFLTKPVALRELDTIINEALRYSSKNKLTNKIGHALKEWLYPILLFLVIVSIWEGVVLAFKIPNYLLPPPHEIALDIYTNCTALLVNTAITMLESFLGFLLAGIFGVLIAISFAHSRIVERSVYPYMIALKAIPIVAIAPLLIVWFGNGLAGKVIMAALVCFFPIIVNATIGLRSVEPEALDLMHSLSASQWQILLKVRFPSALPYIFSALKISSTLSVIGAIVAELAGSDRGIGYMILVSSYRLETTTMFSAIFAVSLGGIIFFGVIALLEKCFLSWHQSSERI